jgi:hypothetical protein
VIDRTGRPRAGFTSPSGNISCLFAAAARKSQTGTVRCEIVKKIWKPPAKPASCPVDWGFGITMQDRPELLCAGDTIRGQHALGTDGSSPLAYGTEMAFGPLSCTSLRTGIDCTNSRTGAEFLLASNRYELRNH